MIEVSVILYSVVAAAIALPTYMEGIDLPWINRCVGLLLAALWPVTIAVVLVAAYRSHPQRAHQKKLTSHREGLPGGAE